MSLSIRTAGQEHLNECVNALLYSDLGRIYFTEEAKARTALLEGLEKRQLSVVFNEDNHFIGFFWLIPQGAFHSFPYLHIIAIKEEYRGKGHGKKIMQYIETRVFKESSKLFLVVADFNPVAKRFYEALGYKETGVIPGLYKAWVTEYLMMKGKG